MFLNKDIFELKYTNYSTIIYKLFNKNIFIIQQKYKHF
jgi:hypothetical protein